MNIITKEQSDMIDEILIGRSISDIAKNVLKLHPSTLYKWLEKDYIKEELEKRRYDLRKSARDKITGHIHEYLNNMIDLANNSTDTRIRFQANKYLLDQCLGTPGINKEEIKLSNKEENKDTNKLKDELDDIKKLKVIK